jgi:ABC-type proline/glycine betaine transport system ATPase subunit
MDHGRLVQHGTAAELLEHPADDFVRTFFQEALAVLAESPGAGP